MTPRPPTPTLFPYTTLFRSNRDADLLVLGSHGHSRLYHAVVGSVAEACIRAATCHVVVEPADRKSTRLNSSHRCISYAVFCLKKKKQRSLARDVSAPYSDSD